MEGHSRPVRHQGTGASGKGPEQWPTRARIDLARAGRKPIRRFAPDGRRTESKLEPARLAVAGPGSRRPRGSAPRDRSPSTRSRYAKYLERKRTLTHLAQHTPSARPCLAAGRGWRTGHGSSLSEGQFCGSDLSGTDSKSRSRRQRNARVSNEYRLAAVDRELQST